VGGDAVLMVLMVLMGHQVRRRARQLPGGRYRAGASNKRRESTAIVALSLRHPGPAAHPGHRGPRYGQPERRRALGGGRSLHPRLGTG